MKLFKILFILGLSLTLTHCLNYDFTRTKVQQGNLLPEHAVARIKVGMSKDEVSSILGNSLLVNTFSDNRWDYAYTVRIGSGPIMKKHVIILFANNRVTSVTRQGV